MKKGYHEEEDVNIAQEMEHVLIEIHVKIMPAPIITGEEKNWDCVPFDEFEDYLPLIEHLLEDASTFGKKAYAECSNTLWKWVDECTYHMNHPELWIQKIAQITHPPMWFFLTNIRYFSDKHALIYAKGALHFGEEDIIKTSTHLVSDALRWHRYGVAQFALDEWRLATFQEKDWTRDYGKIVMGSILEGMDFTGVLPGDGLKRFLAHNQTDILHCITMSRYSMSTLPVASVRFLSALKGGKLDDLLQAYGEFTFISERSPAEGLYIDMDKLGIEMSRDRLLAHMTYSSTGNQWRESFRLLMMRGEMIDLHDACVPTINGSKPKPFGATSVPGPAIQMRDFIKLLTELCEQGDSSRAAAIHYISELVQTDEQMPNRLIEGGLARDFLEIGAVREKNFMIDLGL